jgi:hypothetical protein
VFIYHTWNKNNTVSCHVIITFRAGNLLESLELRPHIYNIFIKLCFWFKKDLSIRRRKRRSFVLISENYWYVWNKIYVKFWGLPCCSALYLIRCKYQCIYIFISRRNYCICWMLLLCCNFMCVFWLVKENKFMFICTSKYSLLCMGLHI